MADLTHLDGHLHAVWVASGDLEASLRFYRDLLGLEVLADRELERPYRGRVVTLTGGSRRCGLLNLLDVAGQGGEPIRAEPHEPLRPGPLAFDFAVDDIEEAYRQLVAEGYEFLAEPQDVGTVDICFCFAPDRVLTALIQFPDGHGLRGTGRPYVGVINTAQITNDMQEELGFYQGVLGLEISLNYVMGQSDREDRLRRAWGAPHGATAHLINLTEERKDGFQGGGTVELIQGVSEQGEPLGERANPPNRGFFMQSLWVNDAAAAERASRESGRPIVSGLAEGALVVRAPSGALVELVQRP